MDPSVHLVSVLETITNHSDVDISDRLCSQSPFERTRWWGVITNDIDYLTIKADGAFPGLPVMWWLIDVQLSDTGRHSAAVAVNVQSTPKTVRDRKPKKFTLTITHANARSNCCIHMHQTMRSAKSRFEQRAFSDSDSDAKSRTPLDSQRLCFS